jgi:hypothetical protein
MGEGNGAHLNEAAKAIIFEVSSRANPAAFLCPKIDGIAFEKLCTSAATY